MIIGACGVGPLFTPFPLCSSTMPMPRNHSLRNPHHASKTDYHPFASLSDSISILGSNRQLTATKPIFICALYRLPSPSSGRTRTLTSLHVVESQHLVTLPYAYAQSYCVSMDATRNPSSEPHILHPLPATSQSPHRLKSFVTFFCAHQMTDKTRFPHFTALTASWPHSPDRLSGLSWDAGQTPWRSYTKKMAILTCSPV